MGPLKYTMGPMKYIMGPKKLCHEAPRKFGNPVQDNINQFFDVRIKSTLSDYDLLSSSLLLVMRRCWRGGSERDVRRVIKVGDLCTKYRYVQTVLYSIEQVKKNRWSECTSWYSEYLKMNSLTHAHHLHSSHQALQHHPHWAPKPRDISLNHRGGGGL